VTGVGVFTENGRMVDLAKVEEIIDRHGGSRDRLIAMLLDCQQEFRYLPRPLIERVASRVGVPVITVLGIATFYRGFSLTPVGERQISVCTGTACQILGAPRLVEAFEQELGIKKGETAPDGKFSLHTINCPGCCGLAPVVTVGENVHSKVTPADVHSLVEQYRADTPARGV
jgi:NADH:ubiquinone oxidoreductase subunit E